MYVCMYVKKISFRTFFLFFYLHTLLTNYNRPEKLSISYRPPKTFLVSNHYHYHYPIHKEDYKYILHILFDLYHNLVCIF